MQLKTQMIKQFKFEMSISELKEKYPIGKEFVSDFMRYKVMGIYQGPPYLNTHVGESSFFAYELGYIR